ncbi:MAG: hypothetical protein QG567_941, partial [Campylobacterota bacterium]|nr:hypothetical protein [Campylobacterota bacterium]
MKKFPIFIAIIFLLNLNAKEEAKLVWPPPPDEPKIEFVQTFAKAEDLKIKKSFWAKIWDFIAGNEDRVLLKPYGLHIDKSGRYLVADTGVASVFIFDKKTQKLEVIEGFKDTRFKSPIDIDSDANGNIYVSDSVLGFVFVFDRYNRPIKKIGSMELKRPTGIAINNALKRLYITDTVTSNINIYSLDGKFIKTIGKYGSSDGEFNKPTFMTIDDANGDIYITDSMNQRIQILTSEGVFIRKFGQIGNSIGDFSSPRGIAIDSEKNIYVSDNLFHA